MKTVAVLSVAALLLLAPSAASQVPDDKLIVPGQRIGALTLQMTIDEVVAALGRQTWIVPVAASGGPAGPPEGRDLQRDLRVHRWDRVGLKAFTRDARSILMLEAQAAPEFVTEKGLKWGLSRVDVERAYGRPTRVTQWGRDPAEVTLQYNEIGLEVWFTPTSTVAAIGVFRPGTASSIWKP